MASTKIPIIYGNKTSKFVHRRTQHRKKISSNLSKSSLDKAQGFIRYHLENEMFEDDPEIDDDTMLGYDDTELYGGHHETQIFPVVECAGSCKSSVFSLRISKKEKGLEHFDSQRFAGISYNFTDYLCQRSQGLLRNQCMSVDNEYGAHQMMKKRLFRENNLRLGNVNKVFCSKWLTSDLIVMGTKCNQLLLYNVNSKKVDHIPCLRGHTNDHPLSEQCGIHALELNPSKTLMATGAQSSNEIAIYRLPTLDPVCMGENAHCDWVFDLCWLNDHFLVSASRDKSLAIWSIDDSLEEMRASPAHGFVEPLCKKKCCGADKVRSLLFNPNYAEIVALSLNAKVHVWDATLFKQVMSQKLELVNENVCMTKTENCSIYAVGSRSHVTLLDPRTLQSINKIDTRKSVPNIRSMSFRGSLLTIGTGTGDILFYDVKAGRYVEGSEGAIELNCSKCKVTENSAQSQSPPENSISDSAIYTHCYDWSGTRLFAAGGPLSATVRGSYASIWW